MSYNFQSSENRRTSMGQSSTTFGGGFSVAGLPPSGSSQLGASTWGSSTSGGSFAGSLSDPMSQNRPHYTPGYLLSASQGSATTSQRHDDAPMVQSRAKLNFPFLRNAASDFGKESMFDATETRPKLLDEDAPPTTSLNDMFNDYTRTHPTSSQPSYAKKSREARGERPRLSQAQPLFVVVYGYPLDQYTATVEFFRSLGENPTDADRHADITNCFRIGYSNPTEAVRAIRKNGEVIHGSYMIGVKWADVAHAESILGSSIANNYGGGVSTPILSSSTPMNLDMAMDEDTPLSPGAGALVPVSVGTPLKLVPSTAAFRQHGTSAAPAHPAPGAFTTAPDSTAAAAPGKGMLGQVSDLIFGW